MTLTLHSMVGRLGIAVDPIISLSRRPVESFLHLVQSPFRVITFGKSFPEVVLFFLKQLRITAHGGSPVGEGIWLRGDGEPSPTGLPPCAVILSCFKKKRSTSGKLSPNVITLNGLWIRWRKGLTGLPGRLMMGATAMPSLPTMECKVRVILSYPTHKVFVKVSKRSVVDMASKLTSKVAEPSKTFWSPPRTKTQWSTKVVPSIGTSVGT